MQLLSIVLCLILSHTLLFTLAINEDDAKEGPCFNISNAVDPDGTWLLSVKKWYYPLASRLDFYRCVHDLLQTEYENIPEFSLYYDSCLEWTINADGYTLIGYDGRIRNLKTTPIRQGTADFQSEWSGGMKGRAYTTLTDNKTFIFTAACFADNQMTWNLFSTKKTLNPATKREIFAHAEMLGYKREYFTETRYDSCSHYRAQQVGGFSTASKSENVLTSSNPPKKGIFTMCKMCDEVCSSSSAQFPPPSKFYKRKLETVYRKISQ